MTKAKFWKWRQMMQQKQAKILSGREVIPRPPSLIGIIENASDNAWLTMNSKVQREILSNGTT